MTPPSSRAIVAVVLGALCAAAACVPAGERALEVEALPEWAAEPELRIGSLDDPDYSLTRVGAMEVAPDGRIYTLHPTEQIVRVFEPDGSLSGTIGGRGDGPGEFQNAISMGWVADTLWVLDVRGYRFSHFTAAGDFLGSFSVPFEPSATPDAVPAPRADGLLWDGTVHGSPPAFSRLVGDGTLTRHVPMLMTRRGTVTDTLPSIAFGRNQWTISDPDSPRDWQSYRRQPFGDGPLWTLAHRERALIVVEREAPTGPDDASFRAAKVTFAGDTIFRRSYPFAPVPIRDAEVDSILDAVGAGMADSDFFGVTAARGRQLAERTLYVPAYRPGVADLRHARDGGIWLSRGRRGGVVSWLVLEEDGEPLARVDLPARLTVFVIDPPYLWGSEADELDVPYVVRYRIET